MMMNNELNQLQKGNSRQIFFEQLKLYSGNSIIRMKVSFNLMYYMVHMFIKTV